MRRLPITTNDDEESFSLDTNLLVRYVRADALSRQIEAEYQLTKQAKPVYISVVVEGEIRSLAERFGWGAARRDYLDQFLQKLVIVPVQGADLVRAYAEIETFSDRMGRPLGSKNDLWITATAHATGTTLLTTDRDFDHLDPLFLRHVWINPVAP